MEGDMIILFVLLGITIILLVSIIVLYVMNKLPDIELIIVFILAFGMFCFTYGYIEGEIKGFKKGEINTYKKVLIEDKWLIDINSIEELREFIKKYEKVVVTYNSSTPNLFTIEIYDDYRE